MGVIVRITLLCIWILFLVQSSKCQPRLVCGFPGAPANGSVSAASEAAFSVNNTVKYSCSQGFILFGDEQRTCQKNGSWSNEIPICDSNVARNKHATQSGQFRQQKASLAVDSDPATCSSTPKTPSERWWQLSLGRSYQVTMVAVTVGVGIWHKFSVYIVSAEGDNRIIYNLCGSFDGTFEFSMVEIKCNNGSGTGQLGEYVFIRDNRPGSFQLSLCEVEVFAYRDDRPCGEPEVSIHGKVKRVNDTLSEYGCQPGYTLKGSALFKCVEGVWESPPPACTELFCPAPLTARGATFTPIYAEWFPPADKRYYPYGTILNYTCEQSFVTEVIGALVCSDKSEWVGTKPLCLPTECGPPPIVPNATFSFLNASQPTRTASLVELLCHDGFYLTQGNAISRCLRSGNWSSINSTCRAIAASNLNGRNLQPALGAILGVVIVLIVVLFVVLALMFLRRRGHLKRAIPLMNRSPASTMVDMSPSNSSVVTKELPTINDQDLYDDVWPSNEAIAGDGLYTDAASSCEDLATECGTDRIYDHPEGNCEEDGDHVYYSPLEGGIEKMYNEKDRESAVDRSHLPPADGAPESDTMQSEVASTANDAAVESEHIYEPLRRSVSPNGTSYPLKPVYAKVDLALKKLKQGKQDYSESSNDSDVAQVRIESDSMSRPQPEGIVTYTVPSFNGESTNNGDSGDSLNSDSRVSLQRPLPPIPSSLQGSVSSVMVDNSLYSEAHRNSWGVVAENELYA